jgi:hypothetical protein
MAVPIPERRSGVGAGNKLLCLSLLNSFKFQFSRFQFSSTSGGLADFFGNFFRNSSFFIEKMKTIQIIS